VEALLTEVVMAATTTAFRAPTMAVKDIIKNLFTHRKKVQKLLEGKAWIMDKPSPACSATTCSPSGWFQQLA
jgi:hypothetical protein